MVGYYVLTFTTEVSQFKTTAQQLIALIVKWFQDTNSSYVTR